jgi:hypothetical protein
MEWFAANIPGGVGKAEMAKRTVEAGIGAARDAIRDCSPIADQDKASWLVRMTPNEGGAAIDVPLREVREAEPDPGFPVARTLP